MSVLLQRAHCLFKLMPHFWSRFSGAHEHVILSLRRKTFPCLPLNTITVDTLSSSLGCPVSSQQGHRQLAGSNCFRFRSFLFEVDTNWLISDWCVPRWSQSVFRFLSKYRKRSVTREYAQFSTSYFNIFSRKLFLNRLTHAVHFRPCLISIDPNRLIYAPRDEDSRILSFWQVRIKSLKLVNKAGSSSNSATILSK